VALLDPDVVLRTDAAAERMGSLSSRRGARVVAAVLAGGAQAVRRALLDGVAGLAWTPGGRVRDAIEFTIDNDGNIIAIDVIGNRQRLGRLDIVVLDD
jgi:RNA polymerase sigma-70 factor, ECF subfamily